MLRKYQHQTLKHTTSDKAAVFHMLGVSMGWVRSDIPTHLHCETPPFWNTPTPKHRSSSKHCCSEIKRRWSEIDFQVYITSNIKHCCPLTGRTHTTHCFLLLTGLCRYLHLLCSIFSLAANAFKCLSILFTHAIRGAEIPTSSRTRTILK